MQPTIDLSGLPLTPALFAHKASGGIWHGAPHLNHMNGVLFDAARSRARGEERNLIINAPPRHGKSMFISQYFTAWWLCNFPDDQILLTAYESNFAADWGTLARESFERMCGSYRGRDGNPLALSESQTASSRWAVRNHAGIMRTAGAGGAILGKGSHLCFPAGTMIRTDIGDVDIADLCRKEYTPRVLSFDHSTGITRWNRVAANLSREVDELVEVRTESGRIVRCTPDHPFHVVGKGYIPAASLVPGDRVLSVRSEGSIDLHPALRDVRGQVREAEVRVRQADVSEAECGVLLRAGVCPEASGDPGREPLCPMRGDQAGQVPSQVLLPGVREAGPSGGQSAPGQDLPRVLNAVPPEVFEDEVLREAMRQCCAFPEDARAAEFALQARAELRPVVRLDEGSDNLEGRSCLRGVQGQGILQDEAMAGPGRPGVQPAHPSHRRGREEQYAGESGDPVLDVPSGPSQVHDDTVSLVVRVRHPGVVVHDIQVERDHNFFAGQILVHNCIIDDPIKNSEDALSEHFNEGLWNWWLTTVRTRREPGCCTIVMMQRWMEDDLVGRMIENAAEGGDHWEVFSYKALAEEDDIIGREPGEALWPSQHPKHKLEITRRTSPFWFAAQYQQDPRVKGGDVFKGVWLRGEKGERIVSAKNLPKFVDYCRFWDRAGSSGKGDYTVGCLVARTHDGYFYVLDVVRGQWSEHERNRKIIATSQADVRRYGTRVRIVSEQEGGSSGKDVAAQFTRMLAGFRVKTFPVTGSKFDFNLLWAEQVEAGNVRIVQADWTEGFIKEHEAYREKGAKHDDQVDAAAGAFSQVVAVQRAGFAAGPTRGYSGKRAGDVRFGGRKTRLQRISYK